MPATLEDKKRSEQIWSLRKVGKTYKEIGQRFGISPERARQIYFREKWHKGEDISK